jgi:hypothetical protein
MVDIELLGSGILIFDFSYEHASTDSTRSRGRQHGQCVFGHYGNKFEKCDLINSDSYKIPWAIRCDFNPKIDGFCPPSGGEMVNMGYVDREKSLAL